MEIEAGKPRAELGMVLRTLAALDLSLTMHGEGIPELRKSGDQSEAVDLQAVLDAHRRNAPVTGRLIAVANGQLLDAVEPCWDRCKGIAEARAKV